MHFVGVDLAWSPRRTSAVAIAAGNADGASLTTWASGLLELGDIVAFIEEATDSGPASIAIDAPLVVPNASGMRDCDVLITALFRSFKAGVIPVNRSNLGRYDGFQGERLARRLEARGYAHGIPLRPHEEDRLFFETYPHAVSIALFQLGERLPYKARGRKRPWLVRREAYRAYHGYLRELQAFEPPLRGQEDLLRRELDGLPEAQRKRHEDVLDAVLCAYTAYYGWYWGSERCAVVGTVEGGCMVLPMDNTLRQRLRLLSSA